MNTDPSAIIFVPGIRPKPPAEQQAEQLRRCLHSSVIAAGGSTQLAGEMADAFRLVGWSHDFYGLDADITPDLPGIERLLAGGGSLAADSEEALAMGRRITSALYAIADRFGVISASSP